GAFVAAARERADGEVGAFERGEARAREPSSSREAFVHRSTHVRADFNLGSSRRRISAAECRTTLSAFGGALELALEGATVDPEHLGGLGDVAAAIREHALDVLPLHASERRGVASAARARR